MANILMHCPSSGNKTITTNGRVYAGVPGTPVSVPEFDSRVLEANGWMRVAGATGATTARPANPRKGEFWTDTTLNAKTLWDGAAWRNAVTGTAANVGPTTLVEDDFIGTNGTAVESRATNIGTKTWTTNAAGAFTLNGSGKAQCAIITHGNYDVFDSGVSDFTISSSISSYAPNGTDCILGNMLFRFQDVDNKWSVQVDPRTNRITLLNFNGASENDVLWQADASVTSNAVIPVRVDCQGPNITLWVNSVRIGTYTSSFLQTRTKCGIGVGANLSSGGTCTFSPLIVTTQAGVKYNWPIFTKTASPVIAKGTSGLWDETDAAAPQVFFDTGNNRYVMAYTGYSAAAGAGNSAGIATADSQVEHLGLAYSTTIDGPWTKEATNPVMTSNSTDGIYAMNGGIVKLGSVYYQVYGSDGGTTVRIATSPDLLTWTRRGVIASATVPTSAAWRNTAVFDAFIRIPQGSSTLELWVCGTNGTDKKFARFTCADPVGAPTTWVEDLVIGPVQPPKSCFLNASAGEPSIYVPAGQEGRQYLLSFDYVPQVASGNPPIGRYIGQGISLDGGLTWAWRVAASNPGTNAWESKQDFDSFVFEANDGTLRIFHSGSDTYGPALDLNMQIGHQSAPWGFTTLLGS